MPKILASAGALVALSGTVVAAPIDLDQVAVDSTDTIAQFVSNQSLQAIDISGALTPALSTELTNDGNGVNQLVSSFTSGFGDYSGTLVSTVYADQALPGLGVDEVLITYEFTNNSGSFLPIDAFVIGTNTGITLDFADLAASQHGNLFGSYANRAANGPQVLLDDTTPTINYNIDFASSAQSLAPGQTASWYILSSTGAVRPSIVDVTVTDASNATARAIIFTTTSEQDDLNVPAPGVGVLALCGLAALRRRRR